MGEMGQNRRIGGGAEESGLPPIAARICCFGRQAGRRDYGQTSDNRPTQADPRPILRHRRSQELRQS
jgi:hypothetical protein